jgi:hypothetical protein
VAVLKETMERETEKEERLEQAKREEKAIAEAQKAKVTVHCNNFILILSSLQIKEAFLDDRKSKLIADERERQRRIARAARGPSPTSETEAPPPPYIPGPGITLAGGPVISETTSLMDDDDDDD